MINGEIRCSYPFIKDPACLSYNRDAALRVAEKVWRSLKKDGLLQAYNEQVQQILDRKAAIKLSKQEMQDYAGPTQYISHHPVLKDSVSTPVRMVTNSSFNNGGKSLNSCLATGPNSREPHVGCGGQVQVQGGGHAVRLVQGEQHHADGDPGDTSVPLGLEVQ